MWPYRVSHPGPLALESDAHVKESGRLIIVYRLYPIGSPVATDINSP